MKRRDRRRGAALALAGIGMGVFLAMVAVGVDLGRLAFTATEVQSVADAAAIAGARTIVDNVHTGGARDPVEDAISVGSANRVAGAPAALTAADVELGHYDPDSHAFTPGGVPQNGVHVTSRVTVQNLVAALIGVPSTEVTRQALAVTAGVGAARPTLPIVVGDCKFNDYENSGSCSKLPSLTLVPDPNDNSGWTSLSGEAASANEVNDILPTECGGGGAEPPLVRVNDDVNVLNGDATTILQTLDSCVKKGLREFTIPIVACGNKSQYNQAMNVVGFATIRIKKVSASGKKKGIDLDSICKSQAGGGVASGNFGTDTVALVR